MVEIYIRHILIPLAVALAFIMDKPGIVMGTEEISHFTEVRSAEGLISQGPYEHRRMISVPVIHIRHSVKDRSRPAGLLPGRMSGCSLFGYAVGPAAVGFKIGFIDYIKTIFIHTARTNKDGWDNGRCGQR